MRGKLQCSFLPYLFAAITLIMLSSKELYAAECASDSFNFDSNTRGSSSQSNGSNGLELVQALSPSSGGSNHGFGQQSVAPAKTYSLSQTITFEEGFDWGGTSEGGKVGFGLYGGTGVTGGSLSSTGWSARLMWRGNNDGTARLALYSYAYDRVVVPGNWGEDYDFSPHKIPVGQPINVVMQVTVNDPGQSNGSVQVWMNGAHVLDRQGIMWQRDGVPSIDSVRYSTFYGGNDSSWSPEGTNYISFSGVCWEPDTLIDMPDASDYEPVSDDETPTDDPVIEESEDSEPYIEVPEEPEVDYPPGVDVLDGMEFALLQNQKMVLPMSENPDGGNVPNYTGGTAAEQHYYALGEVIEDQAVSEAASNPTAQFIYGANASRPDVNLDRHNDPLFSNYNEIRDNATSLTETYADCVDLPTGDPEIVGGDLRTCSVTRSNRVERTECHSSFRAQCTDGAIYGEPITEELAAVVAIESTDDYGATISVDFSAYQWVIQSENGEQDTADQFVQLSTQSVENACSDYYTQFDYIDTQVWSEAGATLGATMIDTTPPSSATPGWTASVMVIEHPSCSNGLKGIYAIGIQSEMFFPTYPHAVGAIFRYQVTHEVSCPFELVEDNNCSLPASGADPVLVSSECIESGYREIQGQQVFAECWDKREFWDVTLLGTDDTSACDLLSDSGCSWQSRECLLESATGECMEEKHTYSCEINPSERAVSLCGDQLVCPDGQCTDDVGQEYESAEDQFLEAAAGMTAASETAAEFDVDLNSFFNGDSKMCTKKVLDFADCCSDTGWGLDIGLDICSTEEVELGLARESGRAIYVGRYTSGSLIDERKNYVYCTYPSEMARVLVQQGKAQLGQTFGSARTPDCSGLSPEELSNLDMDDMDFTSMFPDLLTQAGESMPGGGNLQQLVIDKLEQMFP